MENLELTQQVLRQLKDSTASYKKDFIEQVALWAKQEFKKLEELTTSDDITLYKKFGVSYDLWQGGAIVDPKEYHRKNIYTMREKLAQSRKIVKAGYEEFEQKEILKGIAQFESAIEKLASRIVKKGINLDGGYCRSVRMDENLEITFLDKEGHTAVRAFTIIAWGSVQRPHYRYLVK